MPTLKLSRTHMCIYESYNDLFLLTFYIMDGNFKHWDLRNHVKIIHVFFFQQIPRKNKNKKTYTFTVVAYLLIYFSSVVFRVHFKTCIL